MHIFQTSKNSKFSILKWRNDSLNTRSKEDEWPAYTRSSEDTVILSIQDLGLTLGVTRWFKVNLIFRAMILSIPYLNLQWIFMILSIQDLTFF